MHAIEASCVSVDRKQRNSDRKRQRRDTPSPSPRAYSYIIATSECFLTFPKEQARWGPGPQIMSLWKYISQANHTCVCVFYGKHKGKVMIP